MLDLLLGLLVDLLLGRGNVVKLISHVLDLLGLSRVDVRLTRDVLVALFDLQLCAFIALIEFPLSVLGLGELDLDIPEGVLQLLVLNLAKSEHLTVLDLCTFLSLDTEALASHPLNL